MAEVTVTLKAHGGFEAPWIVVKGSDHDDMPNSGKFTAAQSVSNAIEELRQLGAFNAVKLIAEEFQNAPAAGEEVVKAAFPNAEVVSTVVDPERAAQWDAAKAREAERGASQAPPQQSTPPCETCGSPTFFKSGQSEKGPWSAYKCSSGNKDHTKWMKG